MKGSVFDTIQVKYKFKLKIEDVIIYESLDRIKMDTGRRSALFRIEEKDNGRIEVFTKHIVDGYSADPYLKKIIDWSDVGA